tara:strand:+ start:135 stop:458 length:324 start_codon:yes stop_codon:yes gene_type:complete
MNKFYDIDNTEFAIEIQKSEKLPVEEFDRKVALYTAGKYYFENLPEKDAFTREMIKSNEIMVDQLTTYGRILTTDESFIVNVGYVFRKLNAKDDAAVRVDPTTGKAV